MTTQKLTKNQKQELENMQTNGKIYIGFYSPDIMRTYQSLVKRGLAVEVERTQYGVSFRAL